MSCMKFFNQIKEKIVVESVTICMHLHTKTQMQTLIEVYAAIIFAIHNIIEKSQRTLTWVREMFPLSVYLSVNSGIPNAYHRIYVLPHLLCTNTQDECHSWEHSLWNLWNIHTTRRECIKKHVYVLGVGWKKSSQKTEKRDANGQWSGSLAFNHNKW